MIEVKAYSMLKFKKIGFTVSYTFYNGLIFMWLFRHVS
jgi:hypothetical protein